jgi:hypothetical protein
VASKWSTELPRLAPYLRQFSLDPPKSTLLCSLSQAGETVHCYMRANGAVQQYRTITWPLAPAKILKFSLLGGHRDKRLTLSILAVGVRPGHNVSLAVTVDARVSLYSSSSGSYGAAVSYKRATLAHALFRL